MQILHWALVVFAAAIGFGVLRFAGVWPGAATIAQVLLFVFVAMVVGGFIHFTLERRRRSDASPGGDETSASPPPE